MEPEKGERFQYVTYVRRALDGGRRTSWQHRRYHSAEGEGVSWIPGRHEPDSDEAKALLAAYLLVFR